MSEEPQLSCVLSVDMNAAKKDASASPKSPGASTARMTIG